MWIFFIARINKICIDSPYDLKSKPLYDFWVEYDVLLYDGDCR